MPSDVIDMPVLSRAEILEANEEAITHKYSAYCWQDTLMGMLHEGNRHPITGAVLDSDGNWVCRIVVGPEVRIYSALTKPRFNALGTVPIDVALLEAMAEASESSVH
jgi:hypothetical protein